MVVGSACEPPAGHRGRDRLVASEQLNKAEPNDPCAVDPARRVLAEPGSSNDSIRPQIECDVVRRHDLPELR
jgi:hypothetical protein